MKLKKAMDIFELNADATQEDIRNVYKDLVKIWHPDRFINDTHLLKITESKLSEINEAYKVITSHIKNGKVVFDSEKYQSSDIKKTSQKTKKRSPKISKTILIKRLSGRFFDYILWGTFLELSGLLSCLETKDFRFFVDPIIISFSWVFAETILLGLFGTTPGKELMGIRFIQKYDFRLFFKRSLSVWCYGIGMGFPLITPFSMITAYKTVRARDALCSWEIYGSIKYDRSGFSLSSLSVLMVIAAIFIIQTLYPEQKVKEHIEESNLTLSSTEKCAELIKNNKFKEAIILLNNALDIDPENTAALELLADAKMNISMFEDASVIYEKLLKTDGNNSKILYKLGFCYTKQNRIVEAVKLLTECVSVSPGNHDAHYLLGLLYITAGNKLAAEGRYKALISINADLAEELLSHIIEKFGAIGI